MASLTLILGSACAGPNKQATGLLTGHLIEDGGPPGHRPFQVRGTVTVEGRGFAATTVTDSTGDFSVRVAAGRALKVTARSPQAGGGHILCLAPATITVLEGHPFDTPIYCHIH
jgi:hypothetical protein